MKKRILVSAIISIVFSNIALFAQEVYKNPDLTISKLKDKIWVVETSDMTTMYIIEGEKSAMLIDTGTKCEDLDKVVSKITSKPLQVVLTHVHPDHAGNIGYFDEIYLHPADTVLLGSYNYKGKLNFIKEGYIFDLGGIKIDIFSMPGHTPGSIILVDKQAGDCFSGDSFGSGQVWMQLEPHVPMITYFESCERMEKMMQAGIDKLWCGHYPFVKNYFGIDYIKKMKNLAKRLADGDQEGATPAMMPPGMNFGGKPMTLADGNIAIVYNAEKIN
jgi:Zn-dependent hydrolases, including glyoxylases